MDKQNEFKKQDAQRKQWEDRAEIAKNKAKLEGHKAEEKVSDWNSGSKKNWKRAENRVKEKATEAKNSLEEATQKAKHRIEETFE